MIHLLLQATAAAAPPRCRNFLGQSRTHTHTLLQKAGGGNAAAASKQALSSAPAVETTSKRMCTYSYYIYTYIGTLYIARAAASAYEKFLPFNNQFAPSPPLTPDTYLFFPSLPPVDDSQSEWISPLTNFCQYLYGFSEIFLVKSCISRHIRDKQCG